ncbi:MAG TPA: DNRLRE domain-containing protein [Mycobacteriales bacterium]
MILADSPTTNFDGNWRLSVGTTSTGAGRAMLRFPLTGVPAGTNLDSADLRVYYDQDFGAETTQTIEAHQVTAAWDESTVTWNSANADVGQLGANQVTVDDGDAGTSHTGSWPYSGNTALTALAVNRDYAFNNDATTGDSYTWVPRLTEDGNYRVEAHYVTAGDRSTAAPYTVVGTGTSNVTLDQTAGGTNVGVWGSLGTHPFVSGTTSKVTLHDVGSSAAVIADAVRWTRGGSVVRPANQSNVWHTFPVRNIVQSWLDGAAPNDGFVLKTADESTLNLGGPRYEASEFAYNGETVNAPELVLTYGRPSAVLAAPSVIHATGAELHWSAYQDPGSGTADDIVEYQVHRSVFQTFTPQSSTLVAPVDPGSLAYTDTTATPTPADSPDPAGNAYYYMIAVKTRDGQVIPGPTQLVRLPKAGRVVRIFQGAEPDTTISSAQPTSNENSLTGQPWMMVGDNSGTFGTTRALLGFPDVSALPTNAHVLDATLHMWQFTTIGSGGTYDLHALTRDFDQTTATWDAASSGTAWTSPGGDFTAAVSGSVSGLTNDPHRLDWDATAMTQGWVSNPASNHGAVVKLADEAGVSERSIFVSSEGTEPQLHPELVVTYTEPTAADTYFAPSTPSRMIPGDQYTIPVTLTNTTSGTWSATNRALSYHWTLPDGTDVTNPGNQVDTPLAADLPAGGTVTVNATVKTPIQSAAGNKREQYVLTWDLKNTSTGVFLSASDGIPGLAQNVSVEDPSSDQLGLEKFYQYAGVPTGAGGSVADNLSAGNLVWSYNAFSNPSRGVASFVRITYNSQDTSASSMGFGWSLSASSVMRLGSPLDFHPPGQDWPTTVTLTDGDGTSHEFTLDKHGSTDESLWDYDHPAGVHLYLQKTGSTDPSRAWSMTAPDHTVFYFDSDGYQSAVADANGNELLFTYESRKSNNKPIKFLKYLTDPSGRQTLTLDYYAKGDDYTFIDDTGAEVPDTNLTNPFIIDQVRSITDISGRTVTFTYSDNGLMAEMVDGAGDPAAKTFRFGYDATQGNKNVKLVSVTDPRGHSTALDYYSLPDDDPAFHWWAKTATDRLGQPTTFTYADPDGTAGSQIQTLVTDAASHDTTYLTDGFGRPEQVVDAAGHVTQVHFDADNNVDRLTEANGAVTTWVYDPATGLPQSMTDAQANNDATAASTYTYQTFDSGHTADLATKTSPEGREWAFGYDTQHNVVTVTDPAGTATPTIPDDFTTHYVYDGVGQLVTATDANGNSTHYTDHDANGYPRTITDALNNSSSFVYDVRGQVTTVTDALGHDTTQDYDVFGRPLAQTVPKDQAAGVFITAPAPIYDANDNVTTSTAANGAVTTAVYDADDQTTSTSAPKDTPTGPDRTATFTYDQVGNLLSQTQPDGTLTTADPDDFTTHYTYDPIYELTTVTDAAGHRVTYDYDDVGNMTTEVDANRNATADTTDYTAKYTYDLDHRTKTVTDAAGNVKSVGYDRDGNVVSTTDESGNTTLITLDERGMTSQVQVPFKDDAGATVHNTTRYTYDQVGNQTKVETPRGVATTGVTTDFTAQTTYDALNRVASQLTPFDPNDSRYNTADATTYSYDAVGRVARVSSPPSAGQTVRNDSTYTYFDNGWTKSSVDPWDITATYDYNTVGQQTARTLTSAGGSSARTMSWDYYPDGKLKSRTDNGVPVGAHVVLVDNTDAQNVSAVGTWPASSAAAGFQGFDYQTHDTGTGANSFTWNLTIPQDGTYQVFVKYPSASATNAPYTVTTTTGSTTVPVNQTTGEGTWVSLGSYPFTVNGSGQKVSLTDNANGVVAADAVKLVRDNSGDVDNEDTSFSFAYDPNGNQTQVTDSSPNALIDTYAVTYDGLNQVAKVEEKLAGIVKHTTTFGYDPNGDTLTRTHDAATATFGYDVRGLLASVTNAESASDPNPKTSTYAYTVSGQVLSETKPNGNTVNATYFLDGSLRHQVEKKSNGVTVVAEHTYDYDPNGNQTSDISHLQNADNHAAYVDRTATATYDPRDRVATRTKKDGSGSTVGSESYVYDANDNTISQTVGGSTTTSSYDRNRLQTAVTAGITSAYNYDPFGRLDTVTTAGNLVARYTYDGFDHIASEKKKTGAGFTTTDYTYDPFDRTASQTTDSGGANQKTTVFGYLAVSNALVSETVNGTLTKSYQYSPWGERIAQIIHKTDGSTEPTYYTYNAHSDVDAVTDANGDTKSTYGYTAYGSPEASEATGADSATGSGTDPYNSYRFNAARFDAATGTYDMGFRNYDPGSNRFLTRDLFNGALGDMGLAADPFTNNRYAFGAGNPISAIELDGHLFGLSLSDIGHMALDAAGMIPVVGAVADVANGVWYAAEGDYLDAGLSFAGAIPVIGDAALASRYAVKGAKYAIEGAEAAEDVVKGARTAVRAEHAGQDLVAGAKTADHAAADVDKAAAQAAAARKAAAQAQARAAEARAEAAATGEAEAQAEKVAENTVYRVIRNDEDPVAGLVAKNPSATYKPAAHVRSGSRLSTQYISTTRDLSVAQKWAAKTSNRIVSIDLDLVGGKVLDLSTEAGRLMHLPGNPIAQNYARASAEVLIEGSVPAAAVRLLP